jgi:hypothetical protein
MKMTTVNEIVSGVKPTYEELESQNAEHLATIGQLQKDYDIWKEYTGQVNDKVIQLQGRVAELVDALDTIQCRFDTNEMIVSICESAIKSSQPTADAFVKQVEARALEEAANVAYTWPDDQYAELKLRGMAADKLK